MGTFANELAFEIINDELRSNPFDMFHFDSLTPIASASIGQVYKVRLKANNVTCALKVQRPDAIDTSAIDLYILRKLAIFIKKRYKLRSDLPGVADVRKSCKMIAMSFEFSILW